MTIRDITAILSNEPFFKSIDEIKRLTVFQVNELLFCARDHQTGAVLMEPVLGDGVTPNQRFYRFCLDRRLPAWWVRKTRG